MMSVFVWWKVWKKWSSTYPQTQGFACPHANKVKNLWYSAYRFIWHCFFCVGVSSCVMTLWKLPHIDFKHRNKIIIKVEDKQWMRYQSDGEWCAYGGCMNLDINFKTNIYFVFLCLDRQQWLHPLWHELRMFYDVRREDTIDVALYLYTTYFIFITWSYHQSILFITTSGVNMEGFLSSCDNA